MPANQIRVNIYRSQEANGYWAASPDLDGLAVAGDTRQEVMQEAQWAAETLLQLAGNPATPNLTFADAEYVEE
jgi:predicted RNase H-like HicB family nuclease